jgi:hypothetical protein
MTPAYIDELFKNVNSKTVNFYDSLTKYAKCRQIFKHSFPVIMKMLHLHRLKPLENTQEQVYAKIRGAALTLVTLDYRAKDIFTFYKRRGPNQHRETKKVRALDVSADPEFAIPDLSEDEAITGNETTAVHGKPTEKEEPEPEDDDDEEPEAEPEDDTIEIGSEEDDEE